ncbi:MAG: sugar phosphate isomerase/epimerase family protein [Cyclobacteriaceae bacterium]
MKMYRREALKKISSSAIMGSTYLAIPTVFTACENNTSKAKENEGLKKVATNSLFFSISLAQWSLHRSIFGDSLEKLGWEGFGKMLKENPDALYQGKIDPIDFPTVARERFGLGAIELVNTFYFSKAEDSAYLASLKQRCDDADVSVQLIMCDAEGNLGDIDQVARIQAVENHYKWVDAAKYLGCHSIRVNAAGQGTAEEVKDAAVDGLGRLAEYGKQAGIAIIVENHGGYSSNGAWLSDVIKNVGGDFCGTLPDFGNFCIRRGADGCEEAYDRYQGVSELMPYAKGVSAKTHDFDAEGNETSTDYKKMLSIVKDAGFTGYIGVEYEGGRLSEEEGIRATIKLLESLGSSI